jgi:DNA-binding transcriptional ArsR family regulator
MHVFTILAEPNRRLLLDLLLEGAEPVSRLVEQVDMSQPVVSKHLRILRDAGFVSVKRDGQRRLYSINPKPLEEVDAWIQPYREIWSERLDALENHLGQTELESDR